MTPKTTSIDVTREHDIGYSTVRQCQRSKNVVNVETHGVIWLWLCYVFRQQSPWLS